MIAARLTDIDERDKNASFITYENLASQENLSLSISSPSIWGGNFKIGPKGALGLGIQKKMMNDKATLKVSVSDVLKTNEWSSESILGSLYMTTGGGWDSRRLRVNLTYRFGNEQVKSARRRSTGLEDEKKRVKSN